MFHLILLPVFGAIALAILTWGSSYITEKPISGIIEPTQLPCGLPYVGHGISFFSTRPQIFWRWVAAYQPGKRDYALSILGSRIQIISTPSAVKALLEMRHLGNEFFSGWVVKAMLGLPPLDAGIFQSDSEGFKHVFRRYILKSNSTSELAAVYQQQLCGQLSRHRHKDQCGIELCSWVHHYSFNASVNTIFGIKLLQVYPELEKDLRLFKKNTMHLLARLPRWLFPEPYAIRDKMLLKFEEFHQETLYLGSLDIPNPDAVGWLPSVGSRMWRGLHLWYAKGKMTSPARASLDLGILVATTSNSIPACIWMLLHILDPMCNKNLLADVLDELASIDLEDGKLDSLSLAKLPLLQSIYLEVLRLYTEGLIIRLIDKSYKAAVDPTTSLVIDAGIVAASTWLSHHSKDSFASPPADVFFAERFVAVDSITGKRIFKPGDVAGKMFPYSGGESMCPGRNFAKQEIIGTVASILKTFDLEFIEYLDSTGAVSKIFPSPVAYHLSAGVMVPDGDMRLRVRRRTG